MPKGAARPYWKPRAKGLHPSGHPHIFLENGTQTVKMQFATFPQKIQNRCNFHPCEDENYSGFHFTAPIFVLHLCGIEHYANERTAVGFLRIRSLKLCVMFCAYYETEKFIVSTKDTFVPIREQKNNNCL